MSISLHSGVLSTYTANCLFHICAGLACRLANWACPEPHSWSANLLHVNKGRHGVSGFWGQKPHNCHEFCSFSQISFATHQLSSIGPTFKICSECKPLLSPPPLLPCSSHHHCLPRFLQMSSEPDLVFLQSNFNHSQNDPKEHHVSSML